MDEREQQEAKQRMQDTTKEARRIGQRVREIKQHAFQQHALGNKQAAVAGLNQLTNLSQELLGLGKDARGTLVNLKKEMEDLQKKADAEVAKAKKDEEK